MRVFTFFWLIVMALLCTCSCQKSADLPMKAIAKAIKNANHPDTIKVTFSHEYNANAGTLGGNLYFAIGQDKVSCYVRYMELTGLGMPSSSSELKKK